MSRNDDVNEDVMGRHDRIADRARRELLKRMMKGVIDVLEACLEVDEGTPHHVSFYTMQEHVDWLIDNAPILKKDRVV